MTTNRLGKSSGAFTSKISARQWAQMARDKGLPKHAEAWERAYRAGWDDLQYQPEI
jgi:hypothetical protein